ncbi:MAG TPA: hypothetical protein VKA50_12635 [Gammaproteobacteria bacterium]|nr:hypothetical protein [Gammaproteobacteria bacterium]
MNIYIAAGFAALGLFLFSANASAAGPSVPATSVMTQTIACPQTVNGVKIKRIHQFTVPAGWADEAYGSTGYSGASLYVSRHYISSDGRKLYCGYGARSGNSDYTLVLIVRNAPSGRKCTAGSNHTFRCSMIRRDIRR